MIDVILVLFIIWLSIEGVRLAIEHEEFRNEVKRDEFKRRK
jgi:hypothetical protein